MASCCVCVHVVTDADGVDRVTMCTVGTGRPPQSLYRQCKGSVAALATPGYAGASHVLTRSFSHRRLVRPFNAAQVGLPLDRLAAPQREQAHERWPPARVPC